MVGPASDRELPRSADVVVVGGGAVGLSAAYHLAAAGAGRVLLLEREPELGTGSTGRCAGGFRHQFSSRVNIELSLASIPIITGFSAEHGVPVDVVQDGYLFLLRDEAGWEEFQLAADLQRSLGVPVELLDPAGAAERVPGISTEDVIGATFCALDGIADPAGLTLGFATVARRAGAEIRTRTAVERIVLEGSSVSAVETSLGRVACPIVVDAAGPWAGLVAATAGVDLPLEPLPRVILVTGPFRGVPNRRTLVVDAASSFYFHREGEGVLMGMGDPAQPSTFELRVDDRFVAEELLPRAIQVLPALEEAAIAHSWVGLYEMTPDRHPIIGPAPGVHGLILANGFSGHGFQHAPIVGKLVTEIVVEGAARTVDVSSLGLERFAAGRLVGEAHVV